MVDIVDNIFNIVWVGYLFYAFKASSNYYQKLLDIHHNYYIKINLVYYMIFFRNSINFIYNIIHYHRSYIYILNMSHLDTVNIYHHIQPVISIDNLLLINTDNISYLHQTLLYNISFEYTNIFWHRREL